MKLSDGIRKHGFRKWYERELLQSHAHLALCFICMIGVFAAIDSAAQRSSSVERVLDIGTLLLCAAVGLWALRRYLFLLTHAESVANQADCPACRTYARFHAVAARNDGCTVTVRCTQCGHEWTIES